MCAPFAVCESTAYRHAPFPFPCRKSPTNEHQLCACAVCLSHSVQSLALGYIACLCSRPLVYSFFFFLRLFFSVWEQPYSQGPLIFREIIFVQSTGPQCHFFFSPSSSSPLSALCYFCICLVVSPSLPFPYLHISMGFLRSLALSPLLLSVSPPLTTPLVLFSVANSLRSRFFLTLLCSFRLLHHPFSAIIILSLHHRHISSLPYKYIPFPPSLLPLFFSPFLINQLNPIHHLILSHFLGNYSSSTLLLPLPPATKGEFSTTHHPQPQPQPLHLHTHSNASLAHFCRPAPAPTAARQLSRLPLPVLPQPARASVRRPRLRAVPRPRTPA